MGNTTNSSTTTVLPTDLPNTTVMEPRRNMTLVGTRMTASPSPGLDLKHRLLFVLVGSLFGLILIVAIVFALMCKYGKKANRTQVTPISTDASDEPNDHSPPRPVWSEKSQGKNKK